MSNKSNPFEKNESSEIPAGHESDLPSYYYQQKLLLNHLRSGSTINFLQAREMGIGFLNSRIAELRKEVTIHDRCIRIRNVRCKEYSLAPIAETEVSAAGRYKSIIERRRIG